MHEHQITNVINKCLKAVQNSNLGPLIYKTENGVVTPLDKVDTRPNVSAIGAYAFEVFKVCLISELGITTNIKDNLGGDEWKNL